ncbi:MAG: tetratricopeptide repeat protein [Ignavibacteriaceae bacterium]
MKSTLLLILFALILTGCSKKTEKEYMDAAEKSTQNKNYSEAVKSYQEFLKEYPESKDAPEAIVKMASLYMNHSDSTLSQEQSFAKAAELFKEVYDKYPNSKQAPQALFMSAFVLSNDLNKYDEATKIYRLFLDKFPNHQLAKSAKEELNTMGMTPDDILKKNKNAKNI